MAWGEGRVGSGGAIFVTLVPNEKNYFIFCDSWTLTQKNNNVFGNIAIITERATTACRGVAEMCLSILFTFSDTVG